MTDEPKSAVDELAAEVTRLREALARERRALSAQVERETAIALRELTAERARLNEEVQLGREGAARAALEVDRIIKSIVEARRERRQR